jgi:broad specificity phosphatase PhoE
MTHFLYLVRHGEAAPHDGPLSPAREQQARLTGRRLKDVPLSAIHHGPLPRAAQTASLIAACIPDVPVSVPPPSGQLPADVPSGRG